MPVRLWAAGCALTAAIGIIAAMHCFVRADLRGHVERFNVYPQPEKLIGVALPRQVFSDPALLPVYGSSELSQPQTNRADEFFGSHPTGFGAFLMGNPGETCLMIASRLAAAGPEARGRKAVVFLSPGWFVAPELDHPGFGANFSPLQAGVLAFGSRLSPGLKRDLARRLLDYPEIIGQNPLLDRALASLAGQGENAWLAVAQAPFGVVQIGVQREMDYFRVGVSRWQQRPASVTAMPEEPGPIDWERRLREADAAYTHQRALTSYSTGPRTGFDDGLQRRFVDAKHPERSADENFERACLASKEWTDFELMLKTAREMKIRLLVICQPMNAKFSQLQGLTARSNDLFYARLQKVVEPFKTKLVTFQSDERDPHFYRDCIHPSAKAWIAYDQTLDAFYHEGAVEGSL